MGLEISSLINALPGACAQGLIWGIMAIGVYITYKILDLADLTVDGTMCTGGAVCIVMMTTGHSVGVSMFWAFLAGMAAGLVTGFLHTAMGIPAILAGILTQLSLYSINLRILGGKANQAISLEKYDLLVSLRWIRGVPFYRNTIFVAAVAIVILVAILYWFFGTELGCSVRATGSNPNMSRAQGINTDFTKILGLMLSNGIVALSSVGTVQRVRGYQHGPGRYRGGTGSSYHRRGGAGQDPRKFCFPPAGGGLRRDCLLCGDADRHVAGPFEHQRQQTAFCHHRSRFPGDSVSEGKIFQEGCRKGGRAECLN